MDDDFNAAKRNDGIISMVERMECVFRTRSGFKAVLEALLEKATVLFGIFGIVEKQEALLDDDIQALIDERLDA